MSETDYNARLYEKMKAELRLLLEYRSRDTSSRSSGRSSFTTYPSIAILRRYAAMLEVPNCAIFVSIISRSCGVTQKLS